MKYKVAVTDHGFPNLDIERGVLAELDVGFVEAQCTTSDQVIPVVQDADAILTQWAPITAEVIEAMQRCRAIVRYGIGVDNVDLQAAGAKGIPVINVPDYALDEVADHTMALLLASFRKIPQVNNQIRQGIWETNPCRPMFSLKGKFLGLAGFGNISRKVASRAQAFGMSVLAYDPYVPDAAFTASGVRRVEWSELLAYCDVVSLHLPLTPDTKHIMRAEALQQMKPGSILLNTARGGLIDTEALIVALSRGHLFGAGLDVLEREPIAQGSKLLELPSVILTSHCAWYTEDAMLRLKEYAALEIARVFRGEQPKHIANRAFLVV